SLLDLVLPGGCGGSASAGRQGAPGTPPTEAATRPRTPRTTRGCPGRPRTPPAAPGRPDPSRQTATRRSARATISPLPRARSAVSDPADVAAPDRGPTGCDTLAAYSAKNGARGSTPSAGGSVASSSTWILDGPLE